MEISLFKDEIIYMYLSRFINISEICQLIIHKKNELEKKDTIKYYNHLWETIGGSYFKSTEKGFPMYSYIIERGLKKAQIIAQPDNILDYYLETGISYQVRYTILNQIRDFYLYKQLKMWFNNEDKTLGELTQNIMDQMKEMKYI